MKRDTEPKEQPDPTQTAVYGITETTDNNWILLESQRKSPSQLRGEITATYCYGYIYCHNDDPESSPISVPPTLWNLEDLDAGWQISGRAVAMFEGLDFCLTPLVFRFPMKLTEVRPMMALRHFAVGTRKGGYARNRVAKSFH